MLTAWYDIRLRLASAFRITTVKSSIRKKEASVIDIAKLREYLNMPPDMRIRSGDVFVCSKKQDKGGGYPRTIKTMQV